MSSINLVVTCGCGFKTQTSPTKSVGDVLGEAKNHSDREKHSLCIGGVVKKDGVGSKVKINSRV